MFTRLLKVDLSTASIEWHSLPRVYACEYIGGSGLAARMLWDELDPDRDPLHPDNPLVWINGPLTGTSGPATSRSVVCGRSPKTGLWGESNIGGFVGPELRFAGVDVLWITGCSAEPAYLWINDGKVEFRSASYLWGQADIYQTQELIRAELAQPRARIACIGLAGENQVPMAAIFSDHGRAAGRTGMGALMGSKNLKAVAARGTRPLAYANPDEFRRMRSQINRDLKQHNMTAVMHATGTSGAAEYLQMLGDMPQKYWTINAADGAEKISGGEMAETILRGTSACHACVIACGRRVSIKDGPYATRDAIKGPEYESICSFGSQLMVFDLPLITALADRCDRLGMDSISAGNTIALAYLLYDRGLLSKNDTGGLALRWGDAQPCFQLLEQMARREDFGELLSQGSRALADYCGAPELAVEVNNLEVAMHDPRAFSGQTLSYLLSPRGACHNQSDYFNVELGGSIEELGISMTPRHEDAGKAANIARHHHWRSLCNALVICYFAVVPPANLAALLEAALGQEWDEKSMLAAGERSWNLKRLFNLRLGWTHESEKLPYLLTQPLPDGGQAGYVPDTDLLLREYYEASGWDLKTGWPGIEKLLELNLDFAIES